MCCFSGHGESLAGTSIFARAAAGGGQILVYELTMSARDDVAMILPLPIPPRAREDAVRFIALDGYRNFFAALALGFPEPVSGDLFRGVPSAAQQAPLRVLAVGDFEAS